MLPVAIMITRTPFSLVIQQCVPQAAPDAGTNSFPTATEEETTLSTDAVNSDPKVAAETAATKTDAKHGDYVRTLSEIQEQDMPTEGKQSKASLTNVAEPEEMEGLLANNTADIHADSNLER